ncbi:hypothetical protein M422DRAFT_239240 [Sphaerobolus stellatus SS14]|nr:hypothetical protein M422DRAFT_239240 [Sphaerobolus stellatus SS14]
MPRKTKGQLQREESLRKAWIKLQASESSQILGEVSEAVTEGSDNMSGGADIAPVEEAVPEFTFDFVVESDDEDEIENEIGMDGEIANERDLELFVRTLQEAQNAAQDEERQKNASNKCPSSRVQTRQEATPASEPASEEPEFEMMETPATQWQADEEEIFQGTDVEEGMGTDDYDNQEEAPLPAFEKELPTPNEWLQELLREVVDYSLETATDASLASLTWWDFPALRQARAKLFVLSKDNKIDIFFRGRLSAMIGALSLYLDPTLSYGWRESSVLAAKASGHGVYHAQCIQQWIHRFLMFGKLPLHQYGHSQSVLEDEDFSQTIQLHLQERTKDGYIRAEDIVDFLSARAVS